MKEPQLIEYDGTVYQIRYSGTKKEVERVGLILTRDALVVKFGRSHHLYVKIGQPQAVKYEQVEETFYGIKGKA